MAERVITPKVFPNLATALTDLLAGGVPANKEWSLTVRATNTSAADATFDLVLNNGATTGYRAKSYTVPVGDPKDVEVGLIVTAGCTITGRASAANSLDVTVQIVEHDAGTS